eukprot:365493-Chlamydomonas_euryale.AAC.5
MGCMQSHGAHAVAMGRMQSHGAHAVALGRMQSHGAHAIAMGCMGLPRNAWGFNTHTTRRMAKYRLHFWSWDAILIKSMVIACVPVSVSPPLPKQSEIYLQCRVALNGERYPPFTVHPVTGDRSEAAPSPTCRAHTSVVHYSGPHTHAW